MNKDDFKEFAKVLGMRSTELNLKLLEKLKTQRESDKVLIVGDGFDVQKIRGFAADLKITDDPVMYICPDEIQIYDNVLTETELKRILPKEHDTGNYKRNQTNRWCNKWNHKIKRR